jgi:hypothetical protein
MAGLIVVVGAVAARVTAEGRAELVASDASWSAGDAVGATVHARRAAMAYVPWATHVGRAYRKLHEIAEQSEARGDAETALFAWRAIRTASMGSRSLVTSHDRQREAADLAIARVSAAERSSNSAQRAATGEATRFDTDRLPNDPPPKVGWGALLLVGVGMWIAGGVRLTSRGWDAHGRLDPRQVRTAAVMAAAGLAAWVIGLLMA